MTAWLMRHRRSVLFALAVLTLGGAAAAWQLPVGLFPNIDFPRVAVNVEAGDRAVDRMVVEVTRPLEQALRSVPGVTGIRSTSSRGSAELSVSFAWGGDMVAAQLQIESAVNRSLPALPAGTRFEVRRMDPTVFPVLGLTLSSKTRDLVALHDFATYHLAPLLSAVPGIAAVEVLGGHEAEIEIVLDPARLAAAGLSLDDVANALAASDAVTAAGKLEDRYRLYVTLVDNRLRNLDDIGHTVLKSSPQGVITLASVAEIRPATVPAWTQVTAAGREAVLVNLRQTRGANSLALVAAIRQQLADHAADFPRGIDIATYYDQSELVRNAASSVRDAILIGAALAAIVLLLFLRNLKLTLVVALVLPAVLAATSLLLSALHMSFNMMTLGGFAAAVGLIIDDAVVMVEHMLRRAQENTQRTESSLLPYSAEMLRPLTGSSAATVVIFAPLALLTGVTGGFFKALALTMATALLVSYFVALLVVPLLTDRLARTHRHAEQHGGFFARLLTRYERTAHGALERPWWVVLAAAVLLSCGALAYTRLASGFMPHMDEGGFILDYRAAPGTALGETSRLLRQVEALIQATPEADNYSRRTGLQLGGGITEANEGDFFIHLKSGRRRNIEDVMAGLRAQIEQQVPGLQIETLQLMEDLIGDLTAVPQPIEVKLYSADFEALRKTAPEVMKQLEGISGVVEAQDGLRIAGDALEVHVDRVAAAMEGLDPDMVGKQLEVLLGGRIAGQMQSGEKLVGLRLWTPPSLRARLESLDELRLRAPDGHLLPLKRVARIDLVPGQPQIVRENLEQMVAVTARLENRDLGSAMKDVRKTVAAMQLPAGMRAEYGGLYAEQQSSFRGLLVVFASAVLLVSVLLLFVYESWAVVAAILASVALAVAAVFIGLWLTRTELNISAMMGMTMIVGMVTEIAVFYFAELDTSAAATPDELVAAGRLRLRPILMTTLIAVLALLPLALGLGAGSAMQTPLAVAIISGLVGALPVVLLVMPSIYRRIGSNLDIAKP